MTPWQESEQAALDGLREAVFACDAGYYREGGVDTPAALTASGWLEEEPAHSVLDVHRVVRCEEPDTEDEGEVRVVEGPEVVELFGTARPTRETVERAVEHRSREWFPPFDRGSGCCTVVYDEDGNPVGLCFWGVTGD
ncbi:hypothetical protein [Kitasatospora sp. DSM 101779]|uniref:hypothetical protein n=1 Tax=Kitasatospora sp. DSM 101779 TaxID=2853165 RepID=UPI0021D9327F|nr:hypothetical protein [Kitasatospora sp. DSM 101779]MCU7826357.1 hypothetical protein [Kitasatospora sp. DSM 101779]